MGEAVKKNDRHVKKAVQTRLSEATYNELLRRAKRERRTLAQYLEIQLEEYFQKNPLPLHVVSNTEFPKVEDDNGE